MFAVVHEDDWLLIVDKPAGMPVHAAAGAEGPDLFTMVRARVPEAALLHRLDREASGLVLFGKRRDANVVLQRRLDRKSVV